MLAFAFCQSVDGELESLTQFTVGQFGPRLLLPSMISPG